MTLRNRNVTVHLFFLAGELVHQCCQQTGIKNWVSPVLSSGLMQFWVLNVLWKFVEGTAFEPLATWTVLFVPSLCNEFYWWENATERRLSHGKRLKRWNNFFFHPQLISRFEAQCSPVLSWESSWMRVAPSVFRLVTSFGLVGRYQRVGRTYCLHLHDWTPTLIFSLTWEPRISYIVVRLAKKKK
jgi:hypothetical protein